MQAQRTGPNPSGLCQCGCGERTKQAPQNKRAGGIRKGDYYRFVVHHGNRSQSERYVEEDRGYKTPCWIWALATDRYGNGYGKVHRNGREVMVHRYFYEKHRGAIPEGLHLDHLCRVRQCVNPDHLEPVTQAENLRRGATAKVNWSIVTAIRVMAITTTIGRADMAEAFGVSRGTIAAVLTFHTWRPERSFPDYIKEPM